MHLSRLIVVAVLISCGSTCLATGPASGLSWDNETVPPLVASIIRASGIGDPVAAASYQRELEALAEPIIRQLGEGSADFRTARRLHKLLHDTVLVRYKEDADGIDRVVDNGEYNCVSGTLLYGLIARELGFNVVVVESPRHLYLRLMVNGDRIDIETTSPTGYDMRRDLVRFRRFALAYKYATPEEIEQRGLGELYDEFMEVAAEVSLEKAVAFLWQNVGERALQAGESLRAANCFLEEFRIHPDLVFRADGVRISMVRAYMNEYEAGRFTPALQIAAIDLALMPGRTTARDRLLAAASKRIESDIAFGDLERAEELLSWIENQNLAQTDLVRLEREVCPLLVGAAVRLENWEMAYRMAERFIDAEPDSVESARLLAWVRVRQEDRSLMLLDGVCPDLTKPAIYAGR